MSDVVRKSGGGNVYAQFFSLFYNKGMFVEGKFELNLVPRNIIGAEVRDLIYIVAQTVVAFFFAKADSYVEAGVLAIRPDPQLCTHLPLYKRILLKLR